MDSTGFSLVRIIYQWNSKDTWEAQFLTSLFRGACNADATDGVKWALERAAQFELTCAKRHKYFPHPHVHLILLFSLGMPVDLVLPCFEPEH